MLRDRWVIDIRFGTLVIEGSDDPARSCRRLALAVPSDALMISSLRNCAPLSGSRLICASSRAKVEVELRP